MQTRTLQFRGLIALRHFVLRPYIVQTLQEKMKRMTPMQRERYLEKRKQLMQKRQMKTKMVK